MAKWSKIKREAAPMHPNFCPVIHEDTGKKCNKFMGTWDLDFYSKYGMCETCFLKYNDHINEIAKEWIKQEESLQNE